MSQAAQAITLSPAEVLRQAPVSQAPNGICYATSGQITLAATDLERMIATVPRAAAAALARKAYYFVPLTVSQGEDTVIADRYDVALSDHAVCHRNLTLGDSQCFAELAWKQAESDVRGETRLDAYELRKRATTPGGDAEKHKNAYLAA